VIAQRLVRKVCTKCFEDYEPSAELQKRIRQILTDIKRPTIKVDFEKIVLRRARGCQFCLQGGYKGRIGIFELLKISPTIEKLIYQKPTEEQLLKAAKEEGFVSLQQDALLKALQKITTLEEIERVTGPLS
jgi:type II secretory ATPase GspE/PulE/Tfp pilus assembly ATPase PilB-like protein